MITKIKLYIAGAIATIVSIVVTVLKIQRDNARNDAERAKLEAATREAVGKAAKADVERRVQDAAKEARDRGDEQVKKETSAPGRKHFEGKPW